MYDLLTHARETAEEMRVYLGVDDPGPDTDDPMEIADYWIRHYFESRGYTYYSPAHSARPARTRLAERGWFRRWRVPSIVDPNRRPPMPEKDPLEHDPLARAARRVCIDQTLVMTPGELLTATGGEAAWLESRPETLPASARELYDHLVEISPALQTRRLFVDDEKWRETFGEGPGIWKPGYIRTEYWENEKTGEGLWAFTAFRSRRRENDRGVIPGVWEKVKVLEKVAEALEEPLSHRLYESEGAELKRIIETLHLISFSASINNLN